MQRICPQCGTSNRVPPRHAASTGRCGACKAALPPPSAPVAIDSADQFAALVAEARVPVLVDFWAAWCGPCRAIAPELEKVASHLAGKALVLKVDTEALPELAARHGVRSIPNLLVFHGGRRVRQETGLTSHGVMERWLAEAASA